MPAIMKGFIDRVFSAGFAFKYTNGVPVGLLKGKKATVFVSSGARKILTKVFLGNRFEKLIASDILGFCGIKAKVYQVGNAKQLDNTQIKIIESNVKSALE
jgi:NAD(P)H dehydrogenase (quinone)